MATYVQLKVKGTKVFIKLWHDVKYNEIGGIVYTCGSRQTSDALSNYVIKDSNGIELVTIENHGFRCPYNARCLYIELYDPTGVKQKLTLYYNKSDTTKQGPPIVIEA